MSINILARIYFTADLSFILLSVNHAYSYFKIRSMKNILADVFFFSGQIWHPLVAKLKVVVSVS